MIKSSEWNWEGVREGIFAPWPLLMLAAGIALVAGMALGVFKASLAVAIVGGLFIVILVILRREEVVAVVIIAVHLYVDWYLAQAGVALIMALALLMVCFFAQSPRRPWTEPRGLALWTAFLILAIFPAIQGALTVHDTLIYYPNIVFGAFIIYWLGTVIARDTAHIRRLFELLSVIAVLIAVHTILQNVTGKFLFGDASIDAYIAGTSNRLLDANLAASRSGSFFIDPNWNGTFFAVMLFLPLGLFVESASFLKKLFYLAEMLLILPALLFTYSNGAWIAVCCGFVIFLVFVGRTRDRLQCAFFIVVAVLTMVTLFSGQIALQLQHAMQSDDRVGAWMTGLRILYAFPLTGIGLGHRAYLLRSEPYRALAQDVPLDHPHNSYLEWGAMAGLPVLLVFVALLAFTLWLALRNWARADAGSRTLLGAGIAAVMTLTINSWTINGWTFPTLAALGWLLLGCLSSPLLAKNQASQAEQC